MIKRYFFLFFILVTVNCMAQPGGGGDPGPGEPVPIPFAGILLAAGAAFGAKKILDGRRESNKSK